MGFGVRDSGEGGGGWGFGCGGLGFGVGFGCWEFGDVVLRLAEVLAMRESGGAVRGVRVMATGWQQAEERGRIKCGVPNGTNLRTFGTSGPASSGISPENILGSRLGFRLS